MTQFATFPSKKSSPQSSDESRVHSYLNNQEVGAAGKQSGSLVSAVERHNRFERASFHTPGHKGRLLSDDCRNIELAQDVTELPGLDELSYPTGVIAQLESRAARLWLANESIISVGGASLGLAACMLALASRGTHVLVPRNAHRSLVHGLVLSGLMPVWYEPVWDARWGIWGAATPGPIEQALKETAHKIAGVFAVSPTYAGAISDIQSLAEICHGFKVPLIVDEAHGAHLVPGSGMPASSIALGADVTVHSLHKTLSALTQTGMVHVAPDSFLTAGQIRACMNTLHTSSPSYILLASIEHAISLLESEEGPRRLSRIIAFSRDVQESVSALKSFSFYQSRLCTDPAHILISPDHREPEILAQYLQERGIFAEAVFPAGVLFMLGAGSEREDIHLLVSSLEDFERDHPLELPAAPLCRMKPSFARFPELEQVISCREAFSMPSDVVPLAAAIGRIAAECIAPCPPGIPVCVPGQRIHEDILESTTIRQIRVVHESFD